MKFGDKVIAQGTIRRTVDYVPHGRDKVCWVPVVWKEPRTGILIGWRNLSNGEVDLISYEDGSVYYPKEHFKVGLVVFNERQNPKYIPMDMLHEVFE